MTPESILDIVAHGGWNGGTPVDNTYYEGRGMTFKNRIPVSSRTIEERIGVRSRIAAPEDVRIGVLATENLLAAAGVERDRIRLVIGATNVGEDKNDPGPVVQYPLRVLETPHSRIDALDLYAGCPGFNVAVELVFMLSLSGFLKPDDISVIVGAENIHRAKAFRPLDTANIIFGDDAVATALKTTGTFRPDGTYTASERLTTTVDGPDFIRSVARAVLKLTGGNHVDGIILDNQLGRIEHRVPATAARVQHRLVELMHPEAAAGGRFARFREAMPFYEQHVDAFAFDIMSLTADADFVDRIAAAYVRSGKYKTVVSGYLSRDRRLELTVHRGKGFAFHPPRTGIVDTRTRTHGCFGDYIQAVGADGDVFGEMDGKGVFLYATRGAANHLSGLLSPHGLSIEEMDLVIEHQANFAMIPLTLEQVMADGSSDVKAKVMDFVAHRMLTNVHNRGNCSVVCMQRLPYDLSRGALAPDTVQGYPVNRNLDALQSARIILQDSVGAGMTRSAFLRRVG